MTNITSHQYPENPSYALPHQSFWTTTIAIMAGMILYKLTSDGRTPSERNKDSLITFMVGLKVLKLLNDLCTQNDTMSPAFFKTCERLGYFYSVNDKDGYPYTGEILSKTDDEKCESLLNIISHSELKHCNIMENITTGFLVFFFVHLALHTILENPRQLTPEINRPNHA
jgi:hypothetical protein